MNRRFPWGDTGPAPALRCDECGRRIGRTAHLIYGDGAALLCIRCHMGPRAVQARLHAKYYPDCEHRWHNLGDHHVGHATRAGAWFALQRPEDKVNPRLERHVASPQPEKKEQ